MGVMNKGNINTHTHIVQRRIGELKKLGLAGIV